VTTAGTCTFWKDFASTFMVCGVLLGFSVTTAKVPSLPFRLNANAGWSSFV